MIGVISSRRNTCVGTLLLVLLCVSLPRSAGAQIATPADDAGLIRAARADWVRAFNARDTLALSRSYTADATIINVSGRLLAGDGVASFLRGAVSTFHGIRVDILHLEVRGDLAYEVATYHDTFAPPGAPPLPHNGTQLVVWRRTDRGWQQAALMMSSSFSRLIVPGGS